MTGLHGLTEIREVPAGTPGAIQSSIDGAWRVYVPVTAIITPEIPLEAPTRPLYCFQCGVTKQMKFEKRYWAASVYICECGMENEYFVVTRTGKL